MKEKSIVEFEAITFTENGTGYASAFAFNGLYEIDLENQKCKYMMLFPNENANGKRLYSSALHCNSKIYFIPMSGKYISIYNVEQKTIKQLSIPLPFSEYSFYKEAFKFAAAVCWRGNIFIIPFTYPGILKLDIKTNKITVLRQWIPKEGYFFRGGLCVDGNNVYIPSGNNNIILEFNMETEKGIIHRIGKYNNGAMCMYRCGEDYWIAPRQKGSIVIWNPTCNLINEIKDYPIGFQSGKIVFSKIIRCKDKLFFMPASANRVLSIKIESKELALEDRWKPQENSMVACMFETDEHYYFYEANQLAGLSRHYRICKKDGKTEDYVLEAERQKENQRDRLNLVIEMGDSVKETENFKLEDFLGLI